MEVKQGYKKTEVGVIPSDWEVLKLGEICSFENGDRSSNYPAANEFVSNGIPFINAGHVSDGIISLETMDYIPDSVFNRLSGGKVLSGDILFCLRGSLGKFGLVSSDFGQGAIASSLVIIRPKLGRTTTLYLSSYFKSEICKRMIEFWAGGAAQPNLGAKELEKFLIPLSSKAEQTAIATALNDADALITELEKLIVKKKAIKQGAMQKLLKPKAGWEVRLLGDFLDYEQPTKYVVADTEYNDHNQTPVLTAGKTFILGYTNEEFGVFNNHPVIIFDDFTTATKYIDFPFKVKSSAMKILKPKKDVNLRFVFELMQTIKFDSTDHKRYWISEYRNIEVKVPRPDEQDHISKILSDMDAEIEVLEKKLDKYKMLKQGLMQNLLTGKIRLI